MAEFDLNGKRVAIQEGDTVPLLVDDAPVDVRYDSEADTFSSADLPYRVFSSLDSLARSIVRQSEPLRTRKNAAVLSDDEWRRYCSAVVALKHTTNPDSGVNLYDEFVAMHVCVWGLRFGTEGPAAGVDGAHGGPAFLPWHREFLRRYELALAALDETVSLPYWNWGWDSETGTMELFRDDRMGPLEETVDSGYFAGGPTVQNPEGWLIHEALRPFGATLSRRPHTNASGLPSGAAVEETLLQERFSRFRPALESGSGLQAPGHNRMHNGVHIWVGGDMRVMSSPNDPLFFMHHAQIDRLWALWQRENPGADNYNDGNIAELLPEVVDPMM